MFRGVNTLSQLSIALIFTTSTSVFSQIQVDTTHTDEYLVKEILLGGGVKVGNIQYTGAPHAVGSFNDDDKIIGIQDGLILTSGNVFYCQGPNETASKGWASGEAGDADLNKYTTGFTYDAAVLEFDFITVAENLEFNYVFASEEYLEYVGSKFNDVFAFIISGPNANDVNIARLPDLPVPITINNVNHLYNSSYYINNAYEDAVHEYVYDPRRKKLVKNKEFNKNPELPSYDIQFDGFTVVLKAKYQVIPNEIYHIKIAIADVSDGILDSGVFLEAGSFRSYGDEVVAITKRIYESDLLGIDAIPKLPVSFDLPTVKPKFEVPRIVAKQPEVTGEVLDINFEFDSYAIPDSAMLNHVYNVLSKDPKLKVEIVGHTDYVGSEEYNLQLSQKRSNSAASYLIDKGINKKNIITTFYGESQPIDSNKTIFGRAKNRRVEFIIRSN